MTRATAAWLVAIALGAAVSVHAQDRAAPPAKGVIPAKAAAPAPVPVTRGPVIAPGKPIVAPRIGPMSDSGAIPAVVRNPKAARVSVSARQAAEQTIAALVEAMKNMPKRPPAPPESRTPRARRAGSGRCRAASDAPPPIDYRVTWPSKPEEPGLDRRVELAWPGGTPGAGRPALERTYTRLDLQLESRPTPAGLS